MLDNRAAKVRLPGVVLGLIPLAMVTVGCNAAGDAMSEDEFCQEYAERECAKVALACTFDPVACQPIRSAECRRRAQTSKTDVRVFKPGNAGSCLDEVNRTYTKAIITAADFRALDDECGRVFQGAAKANTTCKVDFDCEKALICDKGLCGPRKVVASGANCGNPGEICPDGQHCRQMGAVYVCANDRALGAACSAEDRCVTRARCQGTCVERAAMGAACGTNEDCVTGYCNPYMRICAAGLNFATGSPSCIAFGAPGGATTDAGAGGADAATMVSDGASADGSAPDASAGQ